MQVNVPFRVLMQFVSLLLLIPWLIIAQQEGNIMLNDRSVDEVLLNSMYLVSDWFM